MNKFILATAVVLPLFFASPLRSEECNVCDKHLKHTNNTLSPIVQFVGTPCMLTDDLGLSILGEVGTKNYRASGTVGGRLGFLSDNNWVKFSGEYLSQKLRYSFYSGQMHRWVNQYALGMDYNFLFPQCWNCSSWLHGLAFNATYSHAFNRHIRSLECPQESQSENTLTLFRNIAGGNNTHLSLGSTFLPWNCSDLFVALDYDYTSYTRKYQHNVRTSGFGGTVRLHQLLANNFALELEAQFRRPFNYYGADLTWTTPFNAGNLVLGAFAHYTHGRDRLPNNTAIGFSIDFNFGGGPLFAYNTPTMFADCWVPNNTGCLSCDSELLAWIARPAVYMPTVLAIADQALVFVEPVNLPTTPPTPPPPCEPPTSEPFPSSSLEIPLFLPFNAGSFFSGEGIVYSISSSNSNIVVNAQTGVVTANALVTMPVMITIIGTNDCGSTFQSGIVVSPQ